MDYSAKYINCEFHTATLPKKFLFQRYACILFSMYCFKSKQLDTTTTDYLQYLELRMCADQTLHADNVPVSFYELYVKLREYTLMLERLNIM